MIKTMEPYQRMKAHAELFCLLSEGKADIATDKVTDGETVTQDILEEISQLSARRS